MRIAVINLPWRDGKRWGARAGGRMPSLLAAPNLSYVPFPYLLAYTAACLEEHGFEVILLDGVAAGMDKAAFTARLDAAAPDLIVAETATASLAHDLRWLEDIRDQRADTPIALFSTHFSAMPEEGLASPAVDFVIFGEPEMTAVELAQRLANGQDIAAVRGIGFKTGHGDMRINPPRAPLDDLDALPYPKRSGLPMDTYSCPGFPAPVVYMYGSRGCPYRCSFCLWTQTVFPQGRYRMRSEENIVAEMIAVLKTYPATRSFYFDDDLFIHGSKRAHRFAAALRAHNLAIPWGMHTRADHWDAESLAALRDCGLFIMKYGIESGNQQIVNDSRKRLDLREAARTLKQAEKIGIKNHIGIIIGLPGETRETIRQTVAFVKSVPVHSVQIAIAVPFPGTELFRYAQEHGLLQTKEWSHFSCDTYPVMRSHALSADELHDALIAVRRAVFMNPRMLWRRLRYIQDSRDMLTLMAKAYRLIRARTRQGLATSP